MNPSIFRAYDIRGEVGKTLFAEDAYGIGFAFAEKVKEKSGEGAVIAVGFDGRTSSPALTKALSAGIEAAKCVAEVIGLVPTPELYFSVYHLKAAAGVMITGSHNPPDHNGFKFMLGKKPFFGDDISALYDAIKAANFKPPTTYNLQLTTRPDIRAAYLTTLLAAYKTDKKLNVVWDSGSGATGEVVEALCAQLPGTHTTLNTKIDGTFPVHHPDPAVAENLEQLIETVHAKKADVGIAFDGDGDRIGVVDDEGEIIWGDQLLAFFAGDVLQKNPGALVIADVKASAVIFDEVKRLGGKSLMWKTGHSHIKAKMQETGAPLAGEMSGHMFFADDYFGFDDGIYAAVRLLNALAQSGKRLSDWRKSLPHYASTPELRIPCDDARKFAVIDEVKAAVAAQGITFNDVDGLRVETPAGWWLLRASNTQAVLVARAEARDATALEVQVAVLRGCLEKFGITFL